MNTVVLNGEEAELRTRRRAVGEKIGRKLFELEQAIQLAAERSAELNAELARAPREAYLSAGYGQGVVSRLAKVQPILADARGEVFLAHTGLAKIGDELGVKLMWPFDDGEASPYSTPAPKPPPAPPSGASEVVPLIASSNVAAA